MSVSIKSVFALTAAALSLCTSVQAASIDFHSRNDLGETASTSAQYKSQIDALQAAPATPGYGDGSVSVWFNVNNNSILGGGTNSSLADHYQVNFDVGSASAGTYEFHVGVDFGGGGTMIIDGAELNTNPNNQWANNDLSDGNASNYLKGSIALGVGHHVLDVYGFEDCCDGGAAGAFRINGGTLQTISVSSLNALIPTPAALPSGLALLALVGLRRRHR